MARAPRLGRSRPHLRRSLEIGRSPTNPCRRVRGSSTGNGASEFASRQRPKRFFSDHRPVAIRPVNCRCSPGPAPSLHSSGRSSGMKKLKQSPRDNCRILHCTVPKVTNTQLPLPFQGLSVFPPSLSAPWLPRKMHNKSHLSNKMEYHKHLGEVTVLCSKFQGRR